MWRLAVALWYRSAASLSKLGLHAQSLGLLICEASKKPHAQLRRWKSGKINWSPTSRRRNGNIGSLLFKSTASSRRNAQRDTSSEQIGDLVEMCFFRASRRLQTRSGRPELNLKLFLNCFSG